MKRTIVAQQGEVKVYKITKLPDNLRPCKPVDGVYIISHSESGHHHVIPSGDADVLERIDDKVPKGMRILYSIVKNPTALRQDAPTPHGEIPMEDGGLYELRVSREYDPFLELARMVAD